MQPLLHVQKSVKRQSQNAYASKSTDDDKRNKEQHEGKVGNGHTTIITPRIIMGLHML